MCTELRVTLLKVVCVTISLIEKCSFSFLHQRIMVHNESLSDLSALCAIVKICIVLKLNKIMLLISRSPTKQVVIDVALP